MNLASVILDPIHIASEAESLEQLGSGALASPVIPFCACVCALLLCMRGCDCVSRQPSVRGCVCFSHFKCLCVFALMFVFVRQNIFSSQQTTFQTGFYY